MARIFSILRDKQVWELCKSSLTEFNHYINSPIAVYKDELYNLPFNMNTFSRLWNLRTPKEAKDEDCRNRSQICVLQNRKIWKSRRFPWSEPDVYEKLIKGYTEKQWGRDCRELPAFIIRRLPLRFTYDNNYFNDRYQGIPVGGYTQIGREAAR